MGSAVGQVPEYIEMVTRWCKDPWGQIYQLLLNSPQVCYNKYNLGLKWTSYCAKEGMDADAVSLINTISSIVSVDLDDDMAPNPTIDGKGTAGGDCGSCG